MEDKPLSNPMAKPLEDVVSLVQQRVLEIYNRRQDARLVFHNYQLATAVCNQVAQIGEAEEADTKTIEIAQLAALFLYTGYLFEYSTPLKNGIAVGERILKQLAYPEAARLRVLRSLEAVGTQATPISQEAQFLWDASQIATYIDNFFQSSPLLQLERNLMTQSQPSKLEWASYQLQQLMQIRLYTHYARVNFESTLSQLIQSLKEQVEKLNRQAGKESPARIFEGLETKIPNRAAQTFFRSNYRNHINLSAIADNKANIMISVNAILISLLISLLTYRNVPERNPMFLMPIIIFLFTGLASLIFAILSARPKVTSINNRQMSSEEIKRNIVFFGNFVTLNLEQFEEAMDTMLRDGELLYGNMTRDLYYLGKVLDKKYRYLTISYNIFMIGFIATVATFLFTLFG